MSLAPSTGAEELPADTPLMAARQSAGLSTSELAAALHLSRSSVSMWEHGHRPVARHYWGALAKALGLSRQAITELFSDQTEARADGRFLPSLGHLRRTAGVPQVVMAGTLGVAVSTLSSWETAGIRVPDAAARAIAGIVGSSITELAAAPPPAEPDARPLRRMRHAAGMTVREAAAHLRISPGTLARYEAGQRTPTPSVLQAMAHAYRQPLNDLRGLFQAPPPLPDIPWTAADLPPLISSLRQRRGLSKVHLGRLVNRSGQAVRAWETGATSPQPDTCRRLELIFGLSPGRLPRPPAHQPTPDSGPDPLPPNPGGPA